MEKKVGIYGGSFDPVHWGHLEAAKSMMQKHGLDEVWFIPANVSPYKDHKPPIACEHRLNMLKLALKEEPRFKLLSLECERPPPSYTVDTLRILKERFPDAEFFLILGEDAAEGLEGWKEPEEIKKLAGLLVLKRGGVSSTEVRRRIASGEDFKKLVPKEIFDYIQQNMLYL